MPVRTSGPLYVGPHMRSDHRFGLLLSNLSGGIAQVQIVVYGAPLVGANDPSSWSIIVNRSVEVETGTVVPITVPLSREYAYYQFFIKDEIFQPCFHVTLYLFHRHWHSRRNTLLIKGNEWEIVPNLPPQP